MDYTIHLNAYKRVELTFFRHATVKKMTLSEILEFEAKHNVHKLIGLAKNNPDLAPNRDLLAIGVLKMPLFLTNTDKFRIHKAILSFNNLSSLSTETDSKPEPKYSIDWIMNTLYQLGKIGYDYKAVMQLPPLIINALIAEVHREKQLDEIRLMEIIHQTNLQAEREKVLSDNPENRKRESQANARLAEMEAKWLRGGKK